MRETLTSAPGLVVDLYLQRRGYDDDLHGVTRKSITDWSDE